MVSVRARAEQPRVGRDPLASASPVSLGNGQAGSPGGTKLISGRGLFRRQTPPGGVLPIFLWSNNLGCAALSRAKAVQDRPPGERASVEVPALLAHNSQRSSQSQGCSAGMILTTGTAPRSHHQLAVTHFPCWLPTSLLTTQIHTERKNRPYPLWWHAGSSSTFQAAAGIESERRFPTLSGCNAFNARTGQIRPRDCCRLSPPARRAAADRGRWHAGQPRSRVG